MNILKADLAHLRNNGHFQFFKEFFVLMTIFTEEIMLRLRLLYEPLCMLYEKEDLALKKIRKSPYTEEIAAADADRIRVFRGFADSVTGALNHYKPVLADAARRLKIVLDAYGNVGKQRLDEKTSAIYNLLAELEENHEDSLIALGFEGWCAELARLNEELAELVRNRDAESAEQPDAVMKSVRMQIDEAYRLMVNCIVSLWYITPDSEEKDLYATFIRRLNAMVERYNSHIATHPRGKAGNGDEMIPDDDDVADDADLTDDAEI